MKNMEKDLQKIKEEIKSCFTEGDAYAGVEIDEGRLDKALDQYAQSVRKEMLEEILDLEDSQGGIDANRVRDNYYNLLEEKGK